jgi:hypothetical protein
MTPLPGLSIIVHTLIIIFYKICGVFRIKLKLDFYKKRIFSYLIVIFISLLAASNTFLLLKLSIRGNNVTMVRGFIAKQELSAKSPDNLSQNVKIPDDNQGAAEAASIDNKDNDSTGSDVLRKNTGSIIDFLADNGIDHSFETRKLIADDLGISDYTGTLEQNTKLIQLLTGVKSFAKWSAIEKK